MSFPRAPLPKQRDKDFEVGALLGRGCFSSVYSAVELATGRHVALKIVDRYRCDRLKKTKDLAMEKHCLLRTSHPNIVKMLGYFTDTLSVNVVLEECVEGELWELVKVVGCPADLAKFYLAQVVNAVEYLRQAGIVHRDLKAENIMIAEKGVVKLIDFGTAKDLENPHIKGSGNASRSKVFEDYVGTPQFMPPEVIGNKFTDFRSDTWSLGCTVFQVLTGAPPFHTASEYLTFQRIIDMDLRFPPGVSPEATDLITRMVVKDADARLGREDINEVRAHDYFKDVKHENIHLKGKPIMSLVDICLQTVGKDILKYKDGLATWKGMALLQPEVREQLERMLAVKGWLDDATPPEDVC